jgi:UDP-2,3-diacylglucosamine pyrophosphatase LpxH
MAKEHYFISDMHMGGDGQLQQCDYTEEFVAFLKELEQKDKETELIIMGDTFGLWESTELHGVAAMEEIIRRHQAIFDQLARTGEKITVTMMVGNHDYDLACDPAYEEVLKRYNITLDKSLSLVREVGGRKIWIEHGMQSDLFNAAVDYGNRYALPIGYFITETVVSGASRYSIFGRGNWLKDIRSVGTMEIPEWLLSNYFYREMNGPIRWFLIPILIFLSLAVFVLIGAVLRWLGIFEVNIFLQNPIMDRLGIIGDLLTLILIIDAIILLVMIIIGVPLSIILKDVRATLERFKLLNREGGEINLDSNEPYLRTARKVFEEHPDVAAYLFGHTHAAFLQEENGRVIINTGSWLKLLNRVSVRFGYLPAVFYPSFRLSYFRISGEGDKVVIDYAEKPKNPQKEMTWVQRFMLAGKKPAPPRAIPARTVI